MTIENKLDDLIEKVEQVRTDIVLDQASLRTTLSDESIKTRKLIYAVTIICFVTAILIAGWT